MKKPTFLCFEASLLGYAQRVMLVLSEVRVRMIVTLQEESDLASYDLDLALGWLQSKGLCAVLNTNDDDAVCFRYECPVSMFVPLYTGDCSCSRMVALRLSSLLQSERVGKGLLYRARMQILSTC